MVRYIPARLLRSEQGERPIPERLSEPEVEVGQKVAFSWGEKIEVGGKEYHLVGESSLLGILHQ